MESKSIDRRTANSPKKQTNPASKDGKKAPRNPASQRRDDSINTVRPNNRARAKPLKNHMPKSLVPCRYGLKCQNPACKFLHSKEISSSIVAGDNYTNAKRIDVLKTTYVEDKKHNGQIMSENEAHGKVLNGGRIEKSSESVETITGRLRDRQILDKLQPTVLDSDINLEQPTYLISQENFISNDGEDSMIAYACDLEESLFESLREKIERRQHDKKIQQKVKAKHHRNEDSIAAEEMRIELDSLLQEQERLRLAEADEHLYNQTQEPFTIATTSLLSSTTTTSATTVLNSAAIDCEKLFLSGFERTVPPQTPFSAYGLTTNENHVNLNLIEPLEFSRILEFPVPEINNRINFEVSKNSIGPVDDLLTQSSVSTFHELTSSYVKPTLYLPTATVPNALDGAINTDIDHNDVQERIRSEEQVELQPDLLSEPKPHVLHNEVDRKNEEEEREKFKLERKAAKKIRKQQEKEAKASAFCEVVAAAESGTESIEPNTISIDNVWHPVEAVTQSKDNNQDMPLHSPASTLEDNKPNEPKQPQDTEREKVVTKKEKTKKDSNDTSKKQQKEQFDKNVKYWLNLLVGDRQTMDMLVQLCAAEFCREHKYSDRSSLLKNGPVKTVLEQTAKKIYQAVCKNDIQRRVIVRGHTQNDLNNRSGRIERWDEKKGQFFVGLDTRRGKKQFVFFFPGNLEVSPNEGQKSLSDDTDLVYLVHIPNLLPDKQLRFDVFKSDVDSMRKAPSLDEFLSSYVKERDIEVQNSQKNKEEEKIPSTEKGTGTGTTSSKWRKNLFENNRKPSRDNMGYFNKHKKCDCVNCCLQSAIFGGVGVNAQDVAGVAAAFISSDPPFYGFTFVDEESDDDDDDDYYYDDDDDDYYDDDDDDEEDLFADDDDDEYRGARYSNYLFTSKRNELEKAAKLLGVTKNAGQDEIKRKWRQLALKYHPDKHQQHRTNGNGMTKEEAERRFKEIGSAYTLLMENF